MVTHFLPDYQQDFLHWYYHVYINTFLYLTIRKTIYEDVCSGNTILAYYQRSYIIVEEAFLGISLLIQNYLLYQPPYMTIIRTINTKSTLHCLW